MPLFSLQPCGGSAVELRSARMCAAEGSMRLRYGSGRAPVPACVAIDQATSTAASASASAAALRAPSET